MPICIPVYVYYMYTCERNYPVLVFSSNIIVSRSTHQLREPVNFSHIIQSDGQLTFRSDVNFLRRHIRSDGANDRAEGNWPVVELHIASPKHMPGLFINN